MSDLDPVDLNMLNEVFENDQTQVREVLVLYLEQAAGQIQKMGEAIQSGAAAELNHHAHKCVGSSTSCGMNRIVPLLRELEVMGKENRLAEAGPVHEKAKAEFAAIETFLKAHLAQ
jgi:HPt (histidine-containing phosphotransfer) domain-containing protein